MFERRKIDTCSSHDREESSQERGVGGAGLLWSVARQRKFHQKKIPKKNFPNFYVIFFFKFFMANIVSRPLWSMPAKKKIGGLGPLVWEEIENEQTVHRGLA
jgi:hypothetical protein